VQSNPSAATTAEEKHEMEQKRKQMQKKLTTDIMHKSQGGNLTKQNTGATQASRHAADGGSKSSKVAPPAQMQHSGSSAKDAVGKSKKEDRKTGSSYSEAL